MESNKPNYTAKEEAFLQKLADKFKKENQFSPEEENLIFKDIARAFGQEGQSTTADIKKIMEKYEEHGWDEQKDVLYSPTPDGQMLPDLRGRSMRFSKLTEAVSKRTFEVLDLSKETGLGDLPKAKVNYVPAPSEDKGSQRG